MWLAGAPATAWAFSDPFAYGDDVEFGGGGGRYFTASIADGYGCNACHEGGAPVALKVTGLPADGYLPGGTYEITVSWPIGVEHTSLVTEILGPDRMPAGTLQLPRPDAMQPGELCSGEEAGFPASQPLDAEDGRQLIGVTPCGAEYVRMLWTAPAERLSDVHFNLGFVSGNDDADVTGDGVTLIDQPLSPGAGDAPTELTQGCSATFGSRGHAVPAWAGWFILTLVGGARRRAPRLER